MWLKACAFVREYRRAMNASREYKRGRRLYLNDQIQDAVLPLQRALRLIGVPRFDSPALFGVRLSVRLESLMFLACAAARLGDRPLTMTTIADGLALLDEIRTFPRSELILRDEFIRSWEQWARSYATPNGTEGSPLPN
jgi:hypothetical protein